MDDYLLDNINRAMVDLCYLFHIEYFALTFSNSL